MRHQPAVPLLRKIASRFLRRLPSSPAQGLGAYWRDLERLEDADVALVSFPKSGRTFVRVMLARLYQQQFGIDEREALKFATLRRSATDAPRILFTHDGDAMRCPDRIRIDAKAYQGRRTVLLARHPGDVVVSRYFHLKHRSHDPARRRLASQPLESFVWTAQGGVPSIVRFLNNWAERARQSDDLLILKYEDFLSDPEASLGSLASFVGLASSESQIKDAVEFARFENLKQKEREGYFSSDRLGPGRSGDERSFKVRSGKSGGYRTSLSDEGRQRVESYLRKHLDPVFGYEA